MKVFLLSFMSCSLLWPIVGWTELYKWTDDQGNFHITDTPAPLTQKKSATFAASAPRSTVLKKTTVRPTLPGNLQAEVEPVLGSIAPSPPREEVTIQRLVEGLSPSQAVLTSSWHIFDITLMKAKVPVQRWKDGQGLDHFVDVLPATRGSSETASKLEDGFVSQATRRAKEQATSVSRSRHQSGE